VWRCRTWRALRLLPRVRLLHVRVGECSSEEPGAGHWQRLSFTEDGALAAAVEDGTFPISRPLTLFLLFSFFCVVYAAAPANCSLLACLSSCCSCALVTRRRGVPCANSHCAAVVASENRGVSSRPFQASLGTLQLHLRCAARVCCCRTSQNSRMCDGGTGRGKGMLAFCLAYPGLRYGPGAD